MQESNQTIPGITISSIMDSDNIGKIKLLRTLGKGISGTVKLGVIPEMA